MLFCFLTPSDSIQAQVRQTRSVGEVNRIGSAVSNAVVTIKNTQTGMHVLLVYSEKTQTYVCSQQQMPIVKGTEYSITVSVPDFQSLESTCRVPEDAAVFNDSVFYGPPYQEFFFQIRRVELKWDDISNVARQYNYFVIESYELFQNGRNTFGGNFWVHENITQEARTFFLNMETTESKTPHTYSLFTTEKSVYDFLVMERRTRSMLEGGASDFFGAYQGIIPTFTNVEGGYGIFGSYLTTSKTIEFK